MKRAVLITIGVIAVVAIAYVYPATTFSIDEGWWIVRYSDQYDIETAKLLQAQYGATILDIEGDDDFNTFGQSFIFIGGSKAFSELAPWAEEWPPDLILTKPTTHPNVRIIIYTWDTAYIETPKGDFEMADGDYGLITRSYDVQLRRWIVLCIGWSAECTAAGARIIAMQPDLLKQHSWIVYEWQGGAVAPSEWTLQAFSNYEIIESG